jgi:molecular chaperone HtpG
MATRPPRKRRSIRRKAIWLRPKSEIKQEEYDEFYKQVARDFEPPLKTIHVAAEGAMEFKALMFIPAHRPMTG